MRIGDGGSRLVNGVRVEERFGALWEWRLGICSCPMGDDVTVHFDPD